MAQLDRPALHDEIDLRFPSNTTEQITPPIVRAFLHNLVDNTLNISETPLRDVHTFRFRTQAEAADAFGGETLDQLKGSDLYTYARVKTEFWRDDPSDLNSPTRYSERIAVYDPRAKPDYWGWRTSGGEAANAGRIGLRLVELDDPAATGVYEYSPSREVRAGQLRFATDSEGAFFVLALVDMSAPVPAPVRGVTTAYWQPADRPPVPGGESADYTAGAGIAITNKVISATSAALVSQHTTFESGRFTGPIQFVQRRPSGFSVQVISNVALLFAQVNYQDVSNPGTWVPGQTYASNSNNPADLAQLLAEVEADIQAIPPAALLAGAEVLFRTYPLDGKLEADFLLTGFNSSTYFGRALAFRVASSGVPIGNIVLNPQFVDASVWSTSGASKVSIGNNQAAISVLDAIFYQVITTQAGDYEVRIRILNLDAGGFAFLGVGPPGSGQYVAQKYYELPGDYVLDSTWPSTAPMQLLVQGSAGTVLAYLYCVPK